MTNMEYYRTKIDELINNKVNISVNWESGEPQPCESGSCESCKFCGCIGTCSFQRTCWLMAEHKDEPTLTQRDYHLVQFLPDGWVSRDKVGMLNWYANKPIQNDAFWVAVNDISMKHGLIIGFGNSILPFIHWEDTEPWSVEDLRKLKVRENND